MSTQIPFINIDLIKTMAFDFFKPKTKRFVDVLEEYFMKISIGLKSTTIEKHKFFYNNILKFLIEKKLHGIMLHEVKPIHIEDLRIWLYDMLGCTREHASRHIKHCQKTFKHAVKMQYFTHNSIEIVETERDKIKEAVSLTAAEIMKLLKSEFDSHTFELVKDLFLFQCFTGLSYMDIWSYKIVNDDGMEWITNPNGRGKNGNVYWSEFNNYAKDICNKYDGIFPEITNQSYNRVIKKIALRLGIHKDLSTHDARKTFATLKYKQGHSIESIADQLGNTPETARKHYITKGNERVKGESERLKDIPLLKFKK